MKWREKILGRLERGDIAFGRSSNGQGMMMLVYETTPTTILARHVPSQTKAEFDFQGQSKPIDGTETITLTSAAPLPAVTYGIVLGLDRKMRLMHSIKHIRLTEDEKRVLREYEEFYAARPFPEDDEPAS
jgi:hypothetical protein